MTFEDGEQSSSSASVRDAADGRDLQWIAQSVVLGRVRRCTPELVEHTIDLALYLALEGHTLPPLGILSDVLALLGEPHTGWDGAGRGEFGANDVEPQDNGPRFGPGKRSAYAQFLPAPVRRVYEDFFLGWLSADASFRAASEFLQEGSGAGEAPVADEEAGKSREYPWGRARPHLVARLFRRLQESASELCPAMGCEISPALLRRVRRSRTGQELIEMGWASWQQVGGQELAEQYQVWARKARPMGAAFDQVDLEELQAGWFDRPHAVRLALRLLLEVEQELLPGLQNLRFRVRESESAADVATELTHEDIYPAGGFSSLTTRGTIESLVKSQLVFLDPTERPDLFDVKYARDELLYYCRDENQFRRSTRHIRIIVEPSVIGARVRDPGLRCQRLLFARGMLKAVISRCRELLTEQSLKIEWIFVESAETWFEQQLVRTVFHRLQSQGVLEVAHCEASQIIDHVRSSPGHILRLCCQPGAGTTSDEKHALASNVAPNEDAQGDWEPVEFGKLAVDMLDLSAARVRLLKSGSRDVVGADDSSSVPEQWSAISAALVDVWTRTSASERR